jgi:hypothetical protein
MRKIGLLVMTVILAIGALGVAYAEWTQAMQIDGTVNTGYISASFANPNPSSPGDTLATIYGEVGTTGLTDANEDAVSDVLTITVDNAYPGYSGTVYFDIVNNGSIPISVSVDKIVIKDGATDITEADPEIIGVVTSIDPLVVIPIGDSGNYHNDSVTISIPQAAKPLQKHTYTISIPLTVNQQPD